MKARHFAATLLLALATPGAMSVAHSDTIRDQVLSDVEFFDSSACQLVNVKFNFPTRVVAHYPYAHGAELRIELDTLSVSGDGRVDVHRRESLNPPKESEDVLSGITYEGNAVPRPYLRLTFRHAVDFKVGQGKDFRSVVVAIRQAQGSGTCEPVYPEMQE